MKHLKSELSILVIGGVLIFFGSLNLFEKESKDLKTKSMSSKSKESGVANKNKETKVDSQLNRVPANIDEVKESKKASVKNDKNTSTLPGFDKINAALQCLETEDCDYPNNDPREYGLEVYQDISRLVKGASNKWSKNWNSFNQDEKTQIINLLDLDSGYVKADMLAFLNGLPKESSSDYYSVVAESVLKYHDANLIPETVKYLKKIKNEDNEKQIASDIAQTIENGSPLVAAELSKHSATFINQNTRDTFKKLSTNLPSSSSESTFVEAALVEHDMITSGG